MQQDLPLEIDVEEAAALKEAGDPARWIDCREDDEWHICRIAGAELVPLSSFAENAPRKLGDPTQRLVVYCHHGVRSLRTVHWLRARGFHRAQSLRGGIERWADLVEPDMARY